MARPIPPLKRGTTREVNAQWAVHNFNVLLRRGREQRVPYTDHITHVWHTPRLSRAYYEGEPRPAPPSPPPVFLSAVTSSSNTPTAGNKRQRMPVAAPSAGLSPAQAPAPTLAPASAPATSGGPSAARPSSGVSSRHFDIDMDALDPATADISMFLTSAVVDDMPSSGVEDAPRRPSSTQLQHQHHKANSSESTRKRARVNYSEDKEDEDDDAAADSDLCTACQGPDLGDYKPGLHLVTCRQCARQWHPDCLNWTPAMCENVDQRTWLCADCNTCLVCNSKVDDDKLLFCDLCDRAYHIYCVNPPLATLPPADAEWHCPQCTRKKRR